MIRSRLLEIPVRNAPALNDILLEQRAHDDGWCAAILEAEHHADVVGERRGARNEGMREIETEVRRLGAALTDAVVKGLSSESVKVLDGEVVKRSNERKALEGKLKASKKATPSANLDSTVDAVMAHLTILAEPAENTPTTTVRTILGSVVEPGSLRLSFEESPPGVRRKYTVSQVAVGLLDARFALSPLVEPTRS